ncbi:MAG TPA: ATP-binding cassette domain-containing protein [Thermoanaerobaculia bacterium]|nr:ATP-binding cassette domain-containing protein [Thermoanaerobaculia bacterium]
MTPCVRFERVGKRFGDEWALVDVDLVIPGGRVTAVVGESGSGKSTLLQLVNAVYLPDAGRVEVFGEPVPSEGLPAFRRRIGYAVQGGGLFPHMSIFDNVTLLARLEGWPSGRIRARFRELLALVDLDEAMADRHPFSLSGGQQQRASLCRAFMMAPELLLLDEPFSAVDPITRLGIHDQFLRLQAAEGTTTVLVTHDMREARKLADHLVILRRGRVVQAGEVREVLARPADEQVERLFEELA